MASICSALRLVAVAVLALVASSMVLAAGPNTVAVPSCPDAGKLPAGGNAEGLRITCEIPAEFRLDVQAAESEGIVLSLLDVAAWRSTDALVEQKAFTNIPGAGKLGWLTNFDGTGVDIAYFTEIDGQPFAYSEARLDSQTMAISKARRLDKPRPASPRERLQLKAKALALAQDALLCTPKRNAVVLEADIGNGPEILVFALSAWTNEWAPMGGHHRFRISADGARVLDHFSQTSICMNYGHSDLERSIALPVSDIQSQTPTSIHVFLSLQYKRPVYVLTTRNERMWKVDGSKISLLDPKDPLYDTLTKWRAAAPPASPAKEVRK